MQTIVLISNELFWAESQKSGEYTQSTIESTLADIGFIHCTSPDQTVMIANRHFTKYENLILLLVDLDKVKSEIKFEESLSGKGGVYPHIYGPLNIDAVYEVIPLPKENGEFITPPQLLRRIN